MGCLCIHLYPGIDREATLTGPWLANKLTVIFGYDMAAREEENAVGRALQFALACADCSSNTAMRLIRYRILMTTAQRPTDTDSRRQNLDGTRIRDCLPRVDGYPFTHIPHPWVTNVWSGSTLTVTPLGAALM